MDRGKTFFFYDLETSGLNAREDRVMQFAGQRTDMELNPIGEPVNILVKMTEDALPSPGAIMVTKITPQDTLRDGITEAEFVKFVTEGDSLIIPGDALDNADLSQEYLMAQRYGVSVIMCETFGEYQLA